MVGLNLNLHLTIFCLKLPCGFHTRFEMWIVILKRRDYVEDIAVNGNIDIHLERSGLRCVSCICLALSRDQSLDVPVH